MIPAKPYGIGLFIIDAILTLMTSGLWLIFVFAREMRYRRSRTYHPRY